MSSLADTTADEAAKLVLRPAPLRDITLSADTAREMRQAIADALGTLTIAQSSARHPHDRNIIGRRISGLRETLRHLGG